jgi:hypothetical protein
MNPAPPEISGILCALHADTMLVTTAKASALRLIREKKWECRDMVSALPGMVRCVSGRRLMNVSGLSLWWTAP